MPPAAGRIGVDRTVITALLLDLDDTLLKNDIDRFLPVYLDRLGAHLDDLVPAERLVPALLAATAVMMRNRDPRRTLEQTFAQAFYPDLRSRFEDFYATVFPELKALTSPIPASRALVESAHRAGIDVAIATNPLFPLTAIEQRLTWSGLAPAEAGFAFVPSYEVMHFCKPDPAYFAEILGWLGKAPHEAAMIGDNEADDLLPALGLGMATFHILQPEQGNLQQARAWLSTAAEHTAPQAARDSSSLLALLRGYLAAANGMTAGLDPAAWARRPEPDSWAPVEILCHLCDVEAEVHLPRLAAVLGGDNPFLSAAVTDPWAEERDYRRQAPAPAVSAFLDARASLLATLQALPEARWESPARHALLGPTTLRELLANAVEHDRLHLAQLRLAITSSD
jgi:FMN phosphatase YigB (HAD superfamily)